MAIRNIRTEEDPILRKKSREVTDIDDRILTLLDDMADTMYEAEGVGLAAVQVGVLRRVVVIDIGDGLMELINPVITERDGRQCEIEGCLSLPGKSGYTMRPETVKVKALNREGKWCVYKGEGLKARAFCHELDHLDGVLYTDNLASEEEISEFHKDDEEE